MSRRCLAGCQDWRPPAEGTATRVARALEAKGIPAEHMRAYLADHGVARFADLCYSHAGAIEAGLTKGILAGDLAVLDPDAPARVYCPRCLYPHSDHDGFGPPCCVRCPYCPGHSTDGDGICTGCGRVPST